MTTRGGRRIQRPGWLADSEWIRWLTAPSPNETTCVICGRDDCHICLWVGRCPACGLWRSNERDVRKHLRKQPQCLYPGGRGSLRRADAASVLAAHAIPGMFSENQSPKLIKIWYYCEWVQWVAINACRSPCVSTEPILVRGMKVVSSHS